MCNLFTFHKCNAFIFLPSGCADVIWSSRVIEPRRFKCSVQYSETKIYKPLSDSVIHFTTIFSVFDIVSSLLPIRRPSKRFRCFCTQDFKKFVSYKSVRSANMFKCSMEKYKGKYLLAGEIIEIFYPDILL